MQALVFGWLLVFASLSLAAEGRLDNALNEEVVFVRNARAALGGELETTLFKPDGPGPFPLVVINHGKDGGDPQTQTRARFRVASREFVRRGYAVMLPMRGGFSRSSGAYSDGGCALAANGLAQAADVRSALDYAASLPYVDASRIVVVGQSHGGLAALALASAGHPGVLAAVNFAGGLKIPLCADWEDQLVAAFAAYGRTSRLPTLWFYGDNDSHWSSETVDRLHARYTGGGGKAKLVRFGRFKADAHNLFADADGLPLWWPEVERLLAGLQLPTELLPRVERPLDAVAQLLRQAGQAPAIAASADCHRLYARFIDVDYPRAFAVSASGSCGYAYGGRDARQRAQEYCRGDGEASCALYVVDDEVVFAGH